MKNIYDNALIDNKLTLIKVIAETQNFIIILVTNENTNKIGICNYCKYSSSIYTHTKDEYFEDIDKHKYKDEIVCAFLSSEYYKMIDLLS